MITDSCCAPKTPGLVMALVQCDEIRSGRPSRFRSAVTTTAGCAATVSNGAGNSLVVGIGGGCPSGGTTVTVTVVPDDNAPSLAWYEKVTTPTKPAAGRYANEPL